MTVHSHDWIEVVALARRRVEHALRRPAMYVGDAQKAHLDIICSPMQVACLTHAFANNTDISVSVDSSRFCLRICSDGLYHRFGSLVDWAAAKDLTDTIGDLAKQTIEELNTYDVHRRTW